MAETMNNRVDRWLLPDGIEEMLPEQARQMESLRRRMIDLFERWGYDYVIPPMLEFTDSLLTGTGQDIDLLTFKITDQLSGRTLGLRADITPQAARMDAHSLKREGINRLCYAGHVIQTAAKSPLSSRSPIKVGVELFGVADVDAEVEVICLLLEALTLTELEKQYIDLGHVGVFRALAEAAGIDDEQEKVIFSLLQSKAFSDIDAWLNCNLNDAQMKSWLSSLPRLSGTGKVIVQARQVFAGAPATVHRALDELQALFDIVTARFPSAQLYFDLSELRGYHYHTGVVFGAFSPGVGNAIASGGRYDHVGEAFGRARSATGFDLDLSAICRLLRLRSEQMKAIFVASTQDPRQWEKVQELRHRGERVVVGIAGQTAPFDYQHCDRVLLEREGKFDIQPI